MPRNAARLEKWLASARPNPNLLEVVREHLDDDLDTPGAIATIDAAAAAGDGVLESAALLGVDLV